MMKYLIGLLFLIACNADNPSKETLEKKAYPKVVGNIEWNAATDANFIQCDSFSNQYYNVAGGMLYEGELAETYY